MKHLRILKNVLPVLALSSLMLGCDDDEPAVPQIDLAAESIEFLLSGDVGQQTLLITGTVKNIGEDYRSNANQQKVVLLERPAGSSSGGKVIDEAEFANLDAGETVEVSYERAWSSGEEFKPTFILRVSYGPDILIDSNPQNDDRNSSNNSIERSSQDVE